MKYITLHKTIKKALLLLSISFLVLSCTSATLDHTVMVPMRDGIHLSTWILFPEEKQEQYPVVLVRTPYKKERRLEQYRYLLKNGYVLVLQDVRGRFGSEGTFEPFLHEGKDGYDAIEWIAGQDWCNGSIGMIGASSNGTVQYAAAAEQPPHLKTIIPNVALVDPFFHGVYRHGVFLPASLKWCAIIEAIAPDEEIYAMNWTQLLDHQPVAELDSIIFSRKLDYYQKWIRHNSKDEYWKQGISIEKLKAVEIPVFIQSGWFDSQLLSCKLAYNNLVQAGNQNVKLIIGPWGHTDRESRFYEGQFMGEAADDIHLQSQYLRWLDHWLKGKENGIMDEPLVRLYAISSNKWYSSDTYPLPYTTDTRLFLSATGRPDLKTKNGALAFRADDVNERIDTFIYDPGNVPLYTEEMLENGKYDLLRKILMEREDYLFYQTAPFREEKTILGQISARIYASSSAADTDWFTVLLVLDDQDKVVDLISFGALRARFRNTFEKPEFLERNKVYPFDLDMSHYGLRLAKGQKLGLIITSSWAYPLMGKNLNTGKNNQTETAYEIAEQKIYHTKEYPSSISLPILNK